MTKLKTHRAVVNLERRGILKAEKYGKTKQLILSNEMKNILK